MIDRLTSGEKGQGMQARPATGHTRTHRPRTRQLSRAFVALALGLLTATVGVTVGAQKAEQEPSVRTYPPFNPSHLVGAEPAPPPDAASDPNAPPPAGGTWTQLASLPPVALDNCLVLTDGDTFCHQHRSGRWYRLKPSNTGSYQNGTWAFDSTMPTGYAPLYFASAVLPDGRVIVAGGEYN